MKSIFFAVSAILFCLTFSAGAQEAVGEETVIRQTIRDISDMWTRENGQEVADRILSEKFAYIAPTGVLNRREFGAFLAGFYRDNQPRKHTHMVKKVVLRGNHAYEFGAVEITLKSGRIVTGDVVNVFVKEQGAWRLLMSLPYDALKEALP